MYSADSVDRVEIINPIMEPLWIIWINITVVKANNTYSSTIGGIHERFHCGFHCSRVDYYIIYVTVWCICLSNISYISHIIVVY